MVSRSQASTQQAKSRALVAAASMVIERSKALSLGVASFRGASPGELPRTVSFEPISALLHLYFTRIPPPSHLQGNPSSCCNQQKLRSYNPLDNDISFLARRYE